MRVKQSTCITVVGAITNGRVVDNLYINHNVDMVKITSIGGIIVDGANLVDSCFYITSNLVSGQHDSILGVFANFNRAYNGTSYKQYNVNNVTYNSQFRFDIFDLATGLQLGNNIGGVIHIDIELIEHNRDSDFKKHIKS